MDREWCKVNNRSTSSHIGIFGKEDSQRKTWFNILMLLYGGLKNDKTQKPDTFATYGNGDPVLEYDAIEDCLRIMDEECVIILLKFVKREI